MDFSDLEKNIGLFNEMLVKGPNRSLRPPKEWWDRKVSQVRSQNPSYSSDKIHATVGAMWYHNMSGKERAGKRHAEGKKYGPAVSKTVSVGKTIHDEKEPGSASFRGDQDMWRPVQY